ncbi:hypothetical protein [Dactylosporangium sp. CA-139066]|uniref:hypothetical protein n=1 Tax=Dactylosporangium sp. CA-139066 TaxID=3239930 RepID=UPI003D94D2AE
MPHRLPLRRRATIRSTVLYHGPDWPQLHDQPLTVTGVRVLDGQYLYELCDQDGPKLSLIPTAHITATPRQAHKPWCTRINAIHHAAADRNLNRDDLQPQLAALYTHIARNERTRAITALQALERSIGIRPHTRHRTHRRPTRNTMSSTKPTSSQPIT